MKVKDVVCKAAPALRKLAKEFSVWEYAEPWAVDVVLKGEGAVRIEIAAGYWTDLASVPKKLRGTFDNGSGEFGVLIASQVHDALYSTHYLSKDFADTIFREMLIYFRIGKLKSWLYYEAVHLFGDRAWEHSDESDRKFVKLFWHE